MFGILFGNTFGNTALIPIRSLWWRANFGIQSI